MEFPESLNSRSVLTFGKWFLLILHGLYFTCNLRIANMDEEMSKLVAVKIIQTYTQLMKRQSESQFS